MKIRLSIYLLLSLFLVTIKPVYSQSIGFNENGCTFTSNGLTRLLTEEELKRGYVIENNSGLRDGYGGIGFSLGVAKTNIPENMQKICLERLELVRQRREIEEQQQELERKIQEQQVNQIVNQLKQSPEYQPQFIDIEKELKDIEIQKQTILSDSTLREEDQKLRINIQNQREKELREKQESLMSEIKRKAYKEVYQNQSQSP